MIALLQLSTVATLGYLCATSGFLVIVASVMFVIKGKVALSESGAPNQVEWGKIKANLTSAVALFALGATMIALPFLRVQGQDARLQDANAQQPATAVLTGKVDVPGHGDVRMLLVVKPDYDQTYRGDIVWEFPLLGKRTSYSVFYIDGDKIVGQQPFSVGGAAPGSAPQKITLPAFGLQIQSSETQALPVKREVSDAELKKLGIN